MIKFFGIKKFRLFLEVLTKEEKEAKEYFDKLPDEIKKFLADKMKYYEEAKNIINGEMRKNIFSISDQYLQMMTKWVLQPNFYQKTYRILEARHFGTLVFLIYELLRQDAPRNIVLLSNPWLYENVSRALQIDGFEIKVQISAPVKNLDKILKSLVHACSTCGKEASEKCSQCKIVYYCDKACQAKDWPTHKAFCKKPEAKAGVKKMKKKEKPSVQTESTSALVGVTKSESIEENVE